MKYKKAVSPILLATLWIGLSEFLRNQLLLNNIWKDHYTSLGLAFPSEPINGALWMLWSLLFAVVLYALAIKYTFWQTVCIGWMAGFIMMWILIGNLSVLPISLLLYAIPLSVLEVIVAVAIINKFYTPTK
jgi:hypothetical protein